MALLNARDVFARRPARLGMWVVRAAHILSVTREELAAGNLAEPEKTGAPAAYYIFQKTRHNGVCIHQGEVEAFNIQHALRLGLEKFADPKAIVWWIIPNDKLLKSDPAEHDLLFESTPGKDYRHENHYRVRTMMRALKAESEKKRENKK